MRELITLQIDGWEKSRWPDGRLSPLAVYEHSYPRKTVVRMEQLLARARTEAGTDRRVLDRVAYYAAPFADFFAESCDYAEGTGRTVLVAQKAGENPAVDGRLTDPAWQRAALVSFVRALDKKVKQPQFPTTVKAVWTADGVTFGFRMAEPKPDRLVRTIRGHDDPMAWWNDNVEVFLDVTGQRTGYYQLIVNPNGAVYDSQGKNTTWTCRGLKTAAHVGRDFWGLEVFVPYAAFTDAVRPATGVVWYANFTRHRIGDKKPREYQRLNTTYEGPSRNMMAFGPIRFVE
ncbi:MAG: carbohydrate-binding family 9-like protein [Chloroflexi bacterium]|nr:carbohydrate-binding family 9-like protein [Chloroflexota bacterium]